MREKLPYFEALSKSIISQQISVKAAANVFSRLIEVTKLEPRSILNMTTDQISYIGLSRQKLDYLLNLATSFTEDPDSFNHLDVLDDKAVIDKLTTIPGIGEWTAQIFLMFTLERADIFAPKDRGLQKAIENIYNFQQTPSIIEMNSIANNWKPYRTTACLHLWQSLHNSPA